MFFFARRKHIGARAVAIADIVVAGRRSFDWTRRKLPDGISSTSSALAFKPAARAMGAAIKLRRKLRRSAMGTILQQANEMLMREEPERAPKRLPRGNGAK
jgi:hypothetical protein